MTHELNAWLDADDESHEEFVDRTWRQLLRREPDPAARERALRLLSAGDLSRSTLMRELVLNDEFRRVSMFDDALAFARGARLRGERPRNLTAPPATDERAIEVPWCLARHDGAPRILDVGYAHAEAAYLAGVVALGGDLTGVDLVEAEVPGLRSVRGDVRALPFDDGSFDVAFCISTLEHVGRNNQVYGLGSEADEHGAHRALTELCRVLSPDGRLLVTVPCGERQELGWQVQHPPADWVALFEGAGLMVFEDEVYELGEEGWRSTASFSPAGVRYGERGPGASAVLCAELRPRRLSSRVRLAVRDIRHRDEPRRSTRGDG